MIAIQSVMIHVYHLYTSCSESNLYNNALLGVEFITLGSKVVSYHLARLSLDIARLLHNNYFLN
jgi:hypothetical protein